MSAFDAKKALVILLGAEEWPHCKSLYTNDYEPGNNPFRNSVTKMESYFRNTLKVDNENIKSWFNSELTASSILEGVEKFINERVSETRISDIFLYYIGHGSFLRPSSKDYYLLVHSTENSTPRTSIQIGDLYDIMKNNAKDCRCYVILDACYSGAATENVPSHPKGIVVFYSSDRTQQSRIDSNAEQKISAFTGTLLDVLDNSKEYQQKPLSLNTLSILVKNRFAASLSNSKLTDNTPLLRCGLYANTPEVEDIEIFPNHNYTSLTVNVEHSLVLGVDVGTTTIKVGLIAFPKDFSVQTSEELPEVLYFKAVKHDEIGRVGILDRVVSVISDVLAHTQVPADRIVRVGVGLPGQVDCSHGILKFAPGLRLRDINVRADLTRKLLLGRNKVFIDNDVKCSTLAELYYGHGRDCKNFVCMFIGTGIGSGIVIDGKLIRGHSFSAGEVGHMRIDSGPDARLCNCGRKGCFEEYASARAIIRLAREKIYELRDRKIESSLLQLNPDSPTLPEEIVEILFSAKKDDSYCQELAEQVASYLAIGIANIVDIINPERIILGGGIINGFFKHDFFSSTLVAYSRKDMLEVCHQTAIVPTSVPTPPEYVPILGAASLNGNN